MTLKQAAKSKINWVSLALLVLGFVTDPQFLDLFPDYGPTILKIAGPLLFILRTCFTKPAPEPERPLVVG
jgi:hypothetical protein